MGPCSLESWEKDLMICKPSMTSELSLPVSPVLLLFCSCPHSALSYGWTPGNSHPTPTQGWLWPETESSSTCGHSHTSRSSSENGAWGPPDKCAVSVLCPPRPSKARFKVTYSKVSQSIVLIEVFPSWRRNLENSLDSPSRRLLLCHSLSSGGK